MGKPKLRLNPQIESIRNRILLERAVKILLSIALMFPAPKEKKGKGRRPYDYRLVMVLCILRILLRKRYSDYESEIRFDKRVIDMIGINNLPCKSTVNNYNSKINLKLLSEFNKKLIGEWVKKPLDLLLDASGIRLVGRSVWFSIKTKQKILKKDCDKIHIAVTNCSLLIANFRITNSKKNDSPFLRKLLEPFKRLGLVIADRGYSGKKNATFVSDRQGAFFCPFKKNARPTALNIWGNLHKLWLVFPTICEAIYRHRNKVEAVFSALKKRYGDQLYSKKCHMRRREMAMRFIAYNVRIIIGIQIAREKNIPLWVKA